MKIKINQRLNEEDTLKDVVDEYGKEVAKDVAEAGRELKPAEGGKVELVIEDPPWVDENETQGGDIERALNDSLREARIYQNRALRAKELYEKGEITIQEMKMNTKMMANNILIVGPAGTGKTQRVEAWCDNNGINMVEKDAKTMDPTDLGGVISRLVDDEGQMTNMATKLTNTEFDILETPDSVLFLDELNRAPQDVAASLLTLIQSHKVVNHDKDHKGTKVLSGMLFTIAAINPSDPEAEDRYNVNNLDQAMKTRFGSVEVAYDKMDYLDYLRKLFSAQLKVEDDNEEKLRIYNRYMIAKHMLLDDRFEFDSPEDERRLGGDTDKALNYRSFENLLKSCDGTATDFLNKWPRFVNPYKKKLADDIMDDYIDFTWEDAISSEDVRDKANSVFDEIQQDLGKEMGGKASEDAFSKLTDIFGQA